MRGLASQGAADFHVWVVRHVLHATAAHKRLLRVKFPVGKLSGVKRWDLADGEVRAERVVLTNVGALVEVVYVVEERGLAAAAGA